MKRGLHCEHLCAFLAELTDNSYRHLATRFVGKRFATVRIKFVPYFVIEDEFESAFSILRKHS